MKILWLTWKDRQNPASGGAEIVNEELARRLAAEGHEVIFVVASFKGAPSQTVRDGFRIVRVGGAWSLYWNAYRYCVKKLKDWPDVVIDEMNTIPFFARFYMKGFAHGNAAARSAPPRHILFVHQLCREIWFYQMFFPLNVIGYFLEPVYLWLLRKSEVITVSKSTKDDLARFGFSEERIRIISEGIDAAPLDASSIAKEQSPTMLFVGAFRKMKRVHHVLEAFEIAKKKIPDLKLMLAGDSSGSYGRKVLRQVARSQYRDSIEIFGKVSAKKKTELFSRAHVLCVASVKEGWGLVVTEAQTQGTPAISYDVDGLRDSVRDGETGLICRKNTPASMAESLIHFFSPECDRSKMSARAKIQSRDVNFEKSYKQLMEILGQKAVDGESGTPISTIGPSGTGVHQQEKERPVVSVIVPTKNSATTLETCLKSLSSQSYKNIEIIVVDNNSADDTKRIAQRYASLVLNLGPERSAQRNFGASKSSGEFLCFIDSDMELSSAVIGECVLKMAENQKFNGLVIPEASFGQGFWAKCKKMEKDFYAGVPWMEAARFMRKRAFEAAGGYDERMISGEDWDLSRRIGELGRIDSRIMHNEGAPTLSGSLRKKFYYAKNIHVYLGKNHGRSGKGGDSKRQASLLRRYALFLSKPSVIARHPAIWIGMMLMKTLEFAAGGFGYMISKKNPK